MARVLVIDDDPDLLTTLNEMLSRAGHKVVVASNAAGGLREYRQHGADDVVITEPFVRNDLVGPDRGGSGSVAATSRGRPELGPSPR
jgi:DNA-binding NtrC family response regulator